MPDQVCPMCQAKGRLLREVNEVVRVEYYRCDECGHVWTYWAHDEQNSNRPREYITTKTKKPN